jgi:hypothetical protein
LEGVQSVVASKRFYTEKARSRDLCGTFVAAARLTETVVVLMMILGLGGASGNSKQSTVTGVVLSHLSLEWRSMASEVGNRQIEGTCHTGFLSFRYRFS